VKNTVKNGVKNTVKNGVKNTVKNTVNIYCVKNTV
jgi:hypothetical protein